MTENEFVAGQLPRYGDLVEKIQAPSHALGVSHGRKRLDIGFALRQLMQAVLDLGQSENNGLVHKSLHFLSPKAVSRSLISLPK
jgi:hypothetical protein